jgi:hypothetical protein
MNTDQLLEDLLASYKLISASDIPNIPLYMDQVTTFMDRHLAPREETEGHILTKTMINNYAKNELLPPPEKKKYSKEHIIMLTFIYYFKNVMSISDIKTVLDPISEQYFDNQGTLTLEDIYEEIARQLRLQTKEIAAAVTANQAVAKESFQAAPPEDKDFLQLLSLICLLSFDVYAKKQLIEKIVAKMKPAQEADDKKTEKKAEKAEKKAEKEKEKKEKKNV